MVLVMGLCFAHFFHQSQQLAVSKPLSETQANIVKMSHRQRFSFVQLKLAGYPGNYISMIPNGQKYEEGDRIAVTGQLEPPRLFSPLSGFLKMEGAPKFLGKISPSFFVSCRRYMTALFEKHLSPDHAALTTALFLGDRSDYFGTIQKNFQLTGTLHYLALSGLHLGLIILPFLMLFRLLRLAPRWQLISCVPFVLFYLGMAGAIPSLLRAFVSFMFVVIAVFSGRSVDKWNGLCAVALICLLIHPAQVHSAGFYMTFFALGGIVFLGPRFIQLWPEQQSVVWKAVAYNTGAWLGIAPVLLCCFGEVYPSALLINIILVPIFTVLLSVCLFFVLLPKMMSFLLTVIWQGIDLLLQNALFFLEGPWGPSRPVVSAVLWSLALLLFVYWENISRKALLALAVSTYVLTMLLPTPQPFENPRVCQLDVGQGSCYLVEAHKGEGVLVDCGGGGMNVGSKIIVPHLRKKGVKSLPYIFLTHLDLDHRVGVEDVLSRFSVGAVVTNKNNQRPELQELKKLLLLYKVSHVELGRGESIDLGGSSISCLHPGVDSQGAPNERSLVLLLEGKKKSVLFTGDIDEEGTPDLLRSNMLTTVDILTAPHHGSRNKYMSLLLEGVQPKEIWLSARPSFPKEPSVLEFPKLIKSWEEEVDRDF